MSTRLGPIQNTHLFFDEEGNVSHRCTLVFDDEQEMIRFNLPSEEDYESTEISEASEEDTPSWFPIYIPKVNYRFLIKHPVVLLRFFNFIDEYNKSITLLSRSEKTKNNLQPFIIPPIPPHVVDHIVNHYQHLNPKHPHRQYLKYSETDENHLCAYVKMLTEQEAQVTASCNMWEILDEGRGLDDWNPVYMPQMNIKFAAYHPKLLVEFFHFINTYNVFHHPKDAYVIKPIPSYIVNCILAHEDVANENHKFFNQQNDINFLWGMLDSLDETKQDTGSQYDTYEEDFPEQAAYDKEFFGH